MFKFRVSSGSCRYMLVAAFLVMGTAYAAVPTIFFDSPRGGEVYAFGQVQKVRLGVKTKAKVVKIELSRDGGATFESLGSIDNTNADKSARNILSFSVGGLASSNCIIRASGAIGKNDVVAVSSPFSIGSAGSPLNGSITSAAITSGAASANFALTADGSGGSSFTDIDGRFVNVAGDAMTGALTLSGDPTAALHAATKQYVDAADAAKVSKTGDSMTGALTLVGDPTSSLHAATKSYVDQPKCRLTQTSTLTLANLSPTAITFNGADYDASAMHDSVANPSRVTCTKAGVYILSCCINITGTSGDYHLFFQKNGVTAIAEIKGPLVSTPYNAASLTTQIALNVGDFVEVILNQSSGTSQTAKQINTNQTPTFCATRLP